MRRKRKLYPLAFLISHLTRKAEYYKQSPESRFIRRSIVDIGCSDIHEVGNESFFV